MRALATLRACPIAARRAASGRCAAWLVHAEIAASAPMAPRIARPIEVPTWREAVSYGDGMADRIRQAASKVDAFIDTFGAGYVQLALELGVEPSRIDTIVNFEAVARYGVNAEGNAAASTASVLAELAGLIAAGELELPIAATFPARPGPGRLPEARGGPRSRQDRLAALGDGVSVRSWCEPAAAAFPPGAALNPGMLLPLHAFEEHRSVDGLRRQHLAHRAVHVWTPHGWILGTHTRREAAGACGQRVTGGRLRQAGTGRRGRGHRREPGGHHRG